MITCTLKVLLTSSGKVMQVASSNQPASNLEQSEKLVTTITGFLIFNEL